MTKKRKRRGRSANDPKSALNRRESGEPGGGQGRRDEVGRSGVYPLGADDVPPGAEIRMAGSWGGGDYDESGGSELVYRDGQLLGGLTAGPDGRPTLDIHELVDGPSEARGDPAPSASDDARDPEPVDPVELRLRGLPKGSGSEQSSHDEMRSEGGRDERRGS